MDWLFEVLFSFVENIVDGDLFFFFELEGGFFLVFFIRIWGLIILFIFVWAVKVEIFGGSKGIFEILDLFLENLFGIWILFLFLGCIFFKERLWGNFE